DHVEMKWGIGGFPLVFDSQKSRLGIDSPVSKQLLELQRHQVPRFHGMPYPLRALLVNRPRPGAAAPFQAVFLEPGHVIPAQKSGQKIAALRFRQAVPDASDDALEYSVQHSNRLPDLI